MSFTDRFIKVPVKKYNEKQKELTGKKILVDSWIKINSFDIAFYEPKVDDDLVEDKECVSITFKSGESMYIYLSVEEFEKLLNKQFLTDK